MENFSTQELNQSLLNCRQILYWLNYQYVMLDRAKTQTKKFRRSLKEQVPDFLFRLENGGRGLILSSCLLKGRGRPLLPCDQLFFTISLQTQRSRIEKFCIYKCLLFSSKVAPLLSELQRNQYCALVSIRPTSAGRKQKLPTQHPCLSFWHQYLLYARDHSSYFQVT